MKVNYKKIILLAMSAASLSLVAVFGRRMNFSAKGEATVHIKTSPEVVLLKIDDEPLFNGQYTATPIKINVKNGRHILKIVRMGYESQIVRLEVTSGEPIHMENIVLGHSSNFTAAAADLTFSGAKAAVSADIDHGFINKKLPFIATQLEANQTHSVNFTIESGQETRSYSCTFQIPSDLQGPLKIHLALKNKLIKATGCLH